jgi:hypothetical protein
LVLVDGGKIEAVAEASIGGFIHPLRASVKAVEQLRQALGVEPLP